MQSLADLIASIPDSPRGILQFISGLLVTHGYVVIFIGAALDNFGLPASGDIVLFAGGWFSNLGRAALPLVMLSGFGGALVSDRKSTRLNSSHANISYAVFCLKKKNQK